MALVDGGVVVLIGAEVINEVLGILDIVQMK
jgi:hypothetical protein